MHNKARNPTASPPVRLALWVSTIMSVDLFSLSKKVHDEETFIEFLRELMNDRENEVKLEKESPSLIKR